MTAHPADHTRPKILLVDDIPANLTVLSDALEPEGYRILAAPSGPVALKIAHRALPDLIVLDVLMPEMDGFETCRRLKEDEATRDIPVIFVTAKGETEGVVEGFRAGGGGLHRQAVRAGGGPGSRPDPSEDQSIDPGTPAEKPGAGGGDRTARGGGTDARSGRGCPQDRRRKALSGLRTGGEALGHRRIYRPEQDDRTDPAGYPTASPYGDDQCVDHGREWDR